MEALTPTSLPESQAYPLSGSFRSDYAIPLLAGSSIAGGYLSRWGALRMSVTWAFALHVSTLR